MVTIGSGLEITSRALILVGARRVRGDGLSWLGAVASFLQLRLGPALGHVALGAHARQEIEEEGEDVEGEDQGDQPFDDGGDVGVFAKGGGGEDDGQEGLDDDEGQFHPEGDAEDAVVAVVDAQPLVFGAQEDGRENVATDEDQEESVVQVGVVVRVEDGEEDETEAAAYGEEDGEAGQNLLGRGRVGGKATAVSEPALSHEAQVEEDGGDDGAGDEERFQAKSPDVTDIGDRLPFVHRWVDRAT